MHRLLLHVFIFAFACIAGCSSAKSDSHFSHHLDKAEIVRLAGNITTLLKPQWDTLSRLSIRRVVIAPGAFREPHWHTNAHQLSYCLRGSAFITIVFFAGGHQTFTISAGQAYFIPSGLLHHTENADSNSTVEFLNVYTNEAMEEFEVSTALGAMTDPVLGNTFQLDAKDFKAVVKHDNSPVFFAMLPTDRQEPRFALLNMYKFDVGKLPSPFKTQQGSIKVVDQRVWGVLEGISMYTVLIGASSMVAPHWHPQVAEMGYVASGKLRMSIVSPDGTVDTFELHAGDTYFVPAGYPHHMENVAEEETFVLMFYDQVTAGTLGYSSTFPIYPSGILAAVLEANSTQMPSLPFYPAHQGWIVPMSNPEK